MTNVTARELEAARMLVNVYCTPKHFIEATAQALADAAAAGYERGRREQREADARLVHTHRCARRDCMCLTVVRDTIRASAGPDGRET